MRWLCLTGSCVDCWKAFSLPSLPQKEWSCEYCCLMNSLFWMLVVRKASCWVEQAPLVICPKVLPNLFSLFLPGMYPQQPGTCARLFTWLIQNYYNFYPLTQSNRCIQYHRMPKTRTKGRHTPIINMMREMQTGVMECRGTMGLSYGEDGANQVKSEPRSLKQRLINQNIPKMSWNPLSNNLIRAILIFILCSVASSNGIYMSLNSSSQLVGSSSIYSISFNRSLNTLGQPITQSSLDTNYQIAIIFDPSYNITPITIMPSTYTLNVNSYTATLTLSSPINTITISSIVNPLPSQTPLKITLNFYNQSSPTVIVDTSSATLTFQSLSISSSAISYSFSPGNVSTQSNLTLTFVPFIWRPSLMAIKLNFLSYWARNMLNVSANQVLGSMSYCAPACTISNMGSFFLIQFNTISLTGNTILLTIYNILSPATLEPADSITITTIENTYSTAVQTGSVSISAATPNNLQVLTPSTTSTIGSSVTLSLTITSQDLFSSSDSIIIVMNTPVAMASSVTIANILVASNDVSVQQNSIITLSNFILVTNIPGQFSGTITITNISAQSSIKPVTGNKISFYRNGHLYDQSIFSFTVNQAPMKTISITLSSSQANANSSMTISVSLTFGVVSSDILYASIDQAISVYSCSVISCPTCTCLTTTANPSLGVFSNLLKITNFAPSVLTSDIIISLSIKNPISSNYALYFTTTDSSNFTKQTGNQRLPNITQSVIPSSVFSFTNTANTVYQPTNFTLGLNFTGYSLLNGWMIVAMDPSITLLDPSTTICIVNGNNGACTLTVVNGSITANISISSLVQVYTVVVNNMRNPTSTKYFSFRVAVYDITNLPYYTLLSSNYQVTTPFTITPQVTSNNCMNSAPNTLSIVFPYLPFTPSSALMVDDPSAASIKGESVLKKLVFPVSFSQNISLSVTNSYSLQPAYYQILVVTNELLYNIFSFSFTMTNCSPNNLSITSFSFTGLPQNAGTLSFVLNQLLVQSSTGSTILGINYLTVLFPSEFSPNMTISTNALSTTQLAPRLFNLTVGNTQPISINIKAFTNVLSSYFTVEAYSVSQTGQFSYLVSSNTNTIRYNLSAITNCSFPCKICTPLNHSTCLQCYSNATTQFYFIDPVAQNCVTPSSCSTNTFPSSAASACVVCPPQCLTCSSSSVCYSCATNYYLLDNSCLTDCPVEYYPVTIQQVCSPCNSLNNTAHCAQCISLNVCSTCLYPYYLSPSTKTCLTACLTNQIPLNGTCFACQLYCATCLGSLSNCTSCLSGYYLLFNGCISSCPSPYVPSPTKNDCVNCSSLCLLCTGNPSTCTACASPLRLFNSTCVDNCPVGYYSFTASNTTQQCLTCPPQCASCSALTNCSSCLPNYYFYNSNCITACPIGTYSTNATTNRICLPCTIYCLTCTSIITCSQCQSGYYISPVGNTTICVSACSLGQYLNGNICENCPSNCVSCLDSSLCLLCSTAYSLQNSLCVSNCSAGSVSIVVAVSLPNSNSTAYVCKPCSTILQYCASCLSTSCSLCQTGYIMNHDKTCVAICPSGYINISSICVSCSLECKSCTNLQNNCTSCTQGYLFYKNTSNNINQCLVGCMSGTYAISGTCQSCLSPCQTCVSTPTSCLSCLGTFYSLTNNGLSCVSTCPSNSYVFNSNCVYCNTGCSLCDASGCLACSPPYYNDQGASINNKIYYDCYSTCPPTLPFTVNNTCMPCAANCQICTNISCLQCNNGTYAYQQFCLLQCPPGMMASAGVCITIPIGGPTNITLNQTASASQALIPVPFSIACVVVMGTVMVSKLAHPHTSISLAIYSLISVVAITCNIFYLFRSVWSNMEQSLYSVMLIVGLLINYVNNVIFLFVSKYTLLRDHQFSCWKRGNVQLIKQEHNDQPSHNNLDEQLNSDYRSQLTDKKVPQKFYTYECLWYLIVTVGMLSSQSVYTIVFSKLFDLSIFKAAVQSVRSLSIMNYLWVVSLIAHLLCLLTGVVQAALASPLGSHYLQSLYQSVDLIFLNFICLVFGLLLLRKKREVWERHPTATNQQDANSTKKVIFDHESHNMDMNGQIQNQSEVNGKIKNLLGTENAGSEQDIVGGQYKSSTVEEASALYFEKDDAQNLDNTQQIKIDNNILWMQINPDQMAPQLIEKEDSHLFEQSAHPSSPTKDAAKNVLPPDHNLDVLDINKIQPDQPSSAGEEEEQERGYRQDNHKETHEQGQNGEEWLMNSSEEGEQHLPTHIRSKSKSRLKNSRKQDKPEQDEGMAEHLNAAVQSEDFDLPEIAEDAENNERDDHEFNHLSNRQDSPTNNHYQSSAKHLNLSKLNAPYAHLQPSEEQRNIDIKRQFQEDDDASLPNEEEDQSIEEQIKNLHQHQTTIHTAAPLPSDHRQSINRQQIAQIIQNQPTSHKPQYECRQLPKTQKREIKTEQGNRKRRRKQDAQSRYVPKQDSSNAKQSKEASKISGLYELFDQYQSQSSPRIVPNQVQTMLNQQSLSLHDNASDHQRPPPSIGNSPKGKVSPLRQTRKQASSKNDRKRYMEGNVYDSIKEEANQLRMSNSAHNLTNKLVPNQLQKHEFMPMLHENTLKRLERQVQGNYRMNHTKTLQVGESQALKKSIYKSINIAKINNRLGINEEPFGLRTMSRDHYTPGLKSQTSNRSASRNNFTSKKVKGDSRVSQSQKKSVWKSRVVAGGSKQQLDGTAKTIERKSKLAEVKAKLESIYLPAK